MNNIRILISLVLILASSFSYSSDRSRKVVNSFCGHKKCENVNKVFFCTHIIDGLDLVDGSKVNSAAIESFSQSAIEEGRVELEVINAFHKEQVCKKIFLKESAKDSVVLIKGEVLPLPIGEGGDWHSLNLVAYFLTYKALHRADQFHAYPVSYIFKSEFDYQLVDKFITDSVTKYFFMSGGMSNDKKFFERDR